MKSLLVVLGGITCSTVFGIIFGYSPYGLTTVTSAFALSIGLLLPIGLVLLQHREIQWKPTLTVGLISGAVILIFLLFALKEFSQLIFVTQDQVRVFSPNNLGDICLHLTH